MLELEREREQTRERGAADAAEPTTAAAAAVDYYNTVDDLISSTRIDDPLVVHRISWPTQKQTTCHMPKYLGFRVLNGP